MRSVLQCMTSISHQRQWQSRHSAWEDMSSSVLPALWCHHARDVPASYREGLLLCHPCSNWLVSYIVLFSPVKEKKYNTRKKPKKKEKKEQFYKPFMNIMGLLFLTVDCIVLTVHTSVTNIFPWYCNALIIPFFDNEILKKNFLKVNINYIEKVSMEFSCKVRDWKTAITMLSFIIILYWIFR